MLLKKQKVNQQEKTKSDYCDTFFRSKTGLIEIESPDLINLSEFNLIYQTEITTRKRSIMKDEINAAVTFLIRIISGSNNQLTKQQTDDLQENIAQFLTNKFLNHWHPDKPSKGQAFRYVFYFKTILNYFK